MTCRTSLIRSVAPHCRTKYQGGVVGSTSTGWRWVGLGTRGWRWVGLGIRGWRWVGLGICKVGGVGSESNHASYILFCSEDHLNQFVKIPSFLHLTSSSSLYLPPCNQPINISHIIVFPFSIMLLTCMSQRRKYLSILSLHCHFKMLPT